MIMVTSSVTSRKDSTMSVRSVAHHVSSSLPAHPIVYGPVPHATHTTSARSRLPSPAPLLRGGFFDRDIGEGFLMWDR